MAVKEKVRVKVKGYDHTVVDAAAAKIVDTAKRTGSRVAGPVPLPTDKEVSPFSAPYTSTRTAVNSSSRELTSALLTLSDLPIRRLKLSRASSFPRALKFLWTSERPSLKFQECVK